MKMKNKIAKQERPVTTPSPEDTSLRRNTRGMSTVEYLILLVVIGVASITLWTRMGKKVKGMATESADQLETISSPD